MPITPEGFVPYTAAESLQQMQDVITGVFGADANYNVGGTNGLLTQELADINQDQQANESQIYSLNFDPRYAAGIFLDCICALNGIQRQPAISSVVTCQLTGISGTVITAGSQILNTNGDIFTLTEEVTIPMGGSIDGIFESLVAAPIACEANTLTRIVQQINGWSTVNNEDAGVIGQNVESDYDLRNKYNYLLGIESSNGIQGLAAAFYNNPDIPNSNVQQNTTPSPLTILGVVIPGNSVYISLDPGQATQDEIAAVIVSKLSPGCGMAGNTNYTYTDPNFSWQTYDVTYEVPAAFGVQFNVVLSGISSDYPEDIDTQIAYAIYNNFYGYDPAIALSRIRIGSLVQVSRFYPSITNLGIYTIDSLTVQALVAGVPASSLQLDLDQLPMVATEDVGPIPPGELDASDIYVEVSFAGS